MYKGCGHQESRAVVARLNETMQELVLTPPAGKVDGGPVGKQLAPRAEARREANMDAAWEGLLRENAPLVFRVARGVLRNDADAEDVAQEALLRAYQRFESLRERERFRAWLVRVTFRLALDRLRTAKRRQQRESQWVLENARAGGSDGGSAEFQRQFDRAVNDLPEKHRLVLLLAAMEGHTLAEVSALIAVPVGTVKSRLFAARKTLAEKLRCFVNRTGGN
jgi:RNA polymerase sigma-70 factor (ECF subfamily)